MRKISFHNKIFSIISSAVLSSIIFGSYIYISLPEKAEVAEIPIISMENVGINKRTYISSDFTKFKFIGDKVADNTMDMPTPPGVPDMPGVNGSSVSNVLSVLGVLPPDVVIISKGGKTITAKLGENTEFGSINYISKNGATIDGRFIDIK